MSSADTVSNWLKKYSFRGLFSRQRPSHDEYVLLDELPLSATSANRRQPPRTPRSIRHHILSNLTTRTAILSTLYIFLAITVIYAWRILRNGIPSFYEDIREIERNLPQHNLSLPYPEGSHGRYVRFPGRITGRGLNNILQEVAFMSHIAYRSNRALAFEEFTWSHSFLPFTIKDLELTPSRIPLGAFVAGPLVGGSLPPTESTLSRETFTHPRSISATYHYATVCPPEKRKYLSPEGAPASGDGKAVMDWWIDRLLAIEDNCVEVDENIQPVFHDLLFYSHRILSAWPEMSTSPFLTHHSWSAIIQAAIVRNYALFSSSGSPPSLLIRQLSDTTKPVMQTLDGLVAMHLRRGDYEGHCQYLTRNRGEYSAHNQLEGLPDKFFPDIPDPEDQKSPSHPPNGSPSPSTTENKREMTPDERKYHYMKHCWPTIDQIVTRASAVRNATATTPRLNRVYVMTNGLPDFILQLKNALLADGWDDVRTTFDLVLDRESRYVSGAVDMAIAERAQVLIGNGFSTLTSNVVMFRTVKGIPLETSRFW